MSRTRLITAHAFLLALFLCLSTAHAAIVAVEANFDGLQVVPPNASPAFGVADATVDDVTGAFTITTGTYNDLLGGATTVLLNDGAAGANGPLIFALTLDTPGAASGTFSGGGLLTAPQLADMLAGNTYIRILTQVFPSGEIRGQLLTVATPEPASLIVWSLLGLSMGAVGYWRQRQRLPLN